MPICFDSFSENNPCGSKPCNETNSKCINQGYDDYMCECKNGFKSVPGSDEKECKGTVVFDHLYTFIHVPNMTFQFKPSFSDIDECAEDECDQMCENTYGSYKCSCETGYKLRKSGGKWKCEGKI